MTKIFNNGYISEGSSVLYKKNKMKAMKSSIPFLFYIIL